MRVMTPVSYSITQNSSLDINIVDQKIGVINNETQKQIKHKFKDLLM
jgi:hypothetical protein